MLQKYEPPRNELGNNFMSAFEALNFGEKFQLPEDDLEETTFELPSAASAGDAREIVRFLSRENASIRINELPTAEPRRVFEAHKLAAYEAWGIVVRDDNHIRLSDLGAELAKRNSFEKWIYRRILSNLPQYGSAVRWIGEQHQRIVTFHDLADFWSDNFPALLLGRRETREIENAALSFFSICHAAELGIMTVGKRGQPTRLSVNADEVESFTKKDFPAEIEIFPPAAAENDFAAKTKREKTISKVYISLGRKKEIGDLIELLELTGFESLTAIDFSLENKFFNQAQISSMQKCSFGLFLLDETHCRRQKNGGFELSDEKIIEINTALVLFNGRIIILWNENENPPSNIRDAELLRIFTGTDSEWETNLQVAKALKEFAASK